MVFNDQIYIILYCIIRMVYLMFVSPKFLVIWYIDRKPSLFGWNLAVVLYSRLRLK